MGTLKSRLFLVTDTATNDKLEACATGKPNEMSTHFTVQSRGEHIRLVQVALSRVKNREPGLKIPEFKVDGNYSPDFARAVFAYKKARGIKNFSSNIDDIVGIKTILSLDKEEGAQGGFPTPAFPPDLPTSIPVRTITQRVFVSDNTPKSSKPDVGDGSGLSTRDAVDAVAEILKSFQDPDFFLGKEDLLRQRIEFINEDFGVNFVDKNTETDIKTITGGDVISSTTTVFIYRYGIKNPNVVVDSRFQSKINGAIANTERRVNMIRRADAQKSQVIVPPRPR